MTGTDKLNSGNPVTVTVNAGTTYADAIDQACATSGSGISNAVWTGTTDKYLDSLKVGDKTYTNKEAIQMQIHILEIHGCTLMVSHLQFQQI